MAELLDFAPVRALTANGLPAAGAKALAYSPGTTTPVTLYTTPVLDVAHATPLVADANGYFPPAYASGSVKIVVTDAANATLFTLDPAFRTPSGSAAASQVTFEPTATLDANNVQSMGEALDAKILARTGADSDRIINGGFSVWQRGASSTTAGYVAADRWGNAFTGGTVTQARQSHTVGTLFGANNPAFFLRQGVTGQSLSTHFANTQQRIEDVRTYSGQAITIMGWAKRNSGTGNMAVELRQSCGTGGSPSADVTAIGATQVTLSGSWEAFAVSVAVPSVSGKTLGTNGDSFLELSFWTSAGSTFSARAASLGIQTIEVDLWGVNVRLGTFTTADAGAYVAPPVDDTLRQCQRYCAIGTTGGPTNADTLFNAGAVATGPFTSFPVTMRGTPTMTYTDLAGTASRFSDISGGVHNQIPTSGTGPVGNATQYGFIPDFAASGSGLSRWRINWTASAEL